MSLGAYTKPKDAGSILLAVLVLVIIAGLVMSTMAAVFKLQSTDRYRVVTTARLTAIQQALNNFALKNNRLPCPTSYTLASSSSLYGVESCAAGAQPPGAVPTRTLGLPEEDRADELNNQFTYAVDDKATTTPATVLAAYIYNHLPSGAVKVAGNPPVWYVLIAHGKDGSGAYTRNGVLAAPCGTAANGQDHLNCSASTTSFSNTPYSEKKGVSHFDDYILFSTTKNFSPNCASIGQVPVVPNTSPPTPPLCEYISGSYGGYYMIYDTVDVVNNTSTPTACRMPNTFPNPPPLPTSYSSIPLGPGPPGIGCNCPVGYTAKPTQDSYVPNCTPLYGMLMGPGTPPASDCSELGYTCNKN